MRIHHYGHLAWSRALLIVLACAAPAIGADTTASWNGEFLENWSDTTQWTPAEIPNNGAVTYNVSLTHGNVLQDVEGGVTINNLTLTDAFLSGSEPLTIVGEELAPEVVSTWTAALQNSEIRNTGGVTVGAGATLEVQGSGPKNLGSPSGGGVTTLAVDGAVRVFGSGSINATGGGAVIETSATGVFDLKSDADFGSVGPSGVINNAGVFSKTAGTGLTRLNSSWTVSNTGVVRVAAGALEARGVVNNDGEFIVEPTATLAEIAGGTSSGSFAVGAGATLEVSAPTFAPQVFSGAAFTGDGELSITGSADFELDATVADTLAVSFSGSRLRTLSPLSLGSVDWSAGSLMGSGGLTIAPGGSATISGSQDKTITTGASLVVAGSVAVTGSGDINTNAIGDGATITVPSGGLFDLQANARFSDTLAGSNPNNVSGEVHNSGVFRKSAGGGAAWLQDMWSFVNDGSVEVEDGQLRFDGTFVNNGVVELSGGGVVLNGDASGPGDFTGSGLATFNGSFGTGESLATVGFGGDVQFGDQATLHIGVAGSDDFDALSIAGSLSLDGDFVASLLAPGDTEEPFTPIGQEDFTILIAEDGVTGAFDSVALPDSAEGYEWVLDIGANSVVLSHVLIPVLVGDYNENGVVDAADFTVWRDHRDTAFDLANRAPGLSGAVSQDDYDAWVAHFGKTLDAISPATNVPEPTALLLVTIASGAFGCRRRAETDKNSTPEIGL
ncbi:hypothetical protein [Pseudobythopirellula maris]|nr:hypothetical protein [Pseudobythopirellula maris]